MAVFIGYFDAMGNGLIQYSGGAGGIRTLDRALQPYNGLANRRLQPLGHSSVGADMPDTGASRKRQIAGRRIPAGLMTSRPLIEALAEIEVLPRRVGKVMPVRPRPCFRSEAASAPGIRP
jgi:hypothetical protein